MTGLKYFELLDGRRYAAAQCWVLPMYDVTDQALTAAYHEFRVPLDLPVPTLYLFSSDGSDHTLLWVFKNFEGGGNEDLPGITRLIGRLGEFSKDGADGVALDLLDRDRELMIAKVYNPVPRIADYLKTYGSQCPPAADA